MEKLINDFSFGLFIWQFVILVILITLMVKFAWKPIMEAITAREEGISNALLAAENAKKDMQNLQADNEKLLAEARAERDCARHEGHAHRSEKRPRYAHKPGRHVFELHPERNVPPQQSQDEQPRARSQLVRVPLPPVVFVAQLQVVLEDRQLRNHHEEQSEGNSREPNKGEEVLGALDAGYNLLQVVRNRQHGNQPRDQDSKSLEL